ncbi:yeast-specific zinc responsive [Caudoviricetes sp.]|nr:yeast-specific zinc responsive [Caudoviricetes sp.]
MGSRILDRLAGPAFRVLPHGPHCGTGHLPLWAGVRL